MENQILMQAVTRTHYGLPAVLTVKDIPKPQPKPNEILLRVHATTVNRTDCGILTGKPYLIRAFVGLRQPTDLVPGTDFAGQIEAIGEKVTNFQVGDRVWGLNDEGLQSQAQYMTIRADRAIGLIPENVSYVQAVASAEGAHYARNFINKIKVKSGDRVLLNGATGAIGSAAIQLLKNLGCYVTAVGPTNYRDQVMELGADKFYSYQTENFTEDQEKYHYVFDAVGKSRFSTCKHLLHSGGVYISSELGPGAENLYLPITTIFSDKKVSFPVPYQSKKTIEEMGKLLAAGKFQPLIDRTYSADQVQEAYEYVMSGQKVGNVILEF